MKSFFVRVLAILIMAALMLSLVACTNAPQRQKKITEMFDSFPKSDQYILALKDKILMGDKEIDLNSVTYNGKRCNVIAVEENGAWAYFSSGEAENTLGIVYITYDPVEIQLLTTVENFSYVIHTEYCENKLYFRVSDPENDRKQRYFVYDVLNGESVYIDTNKMPDDFERTVDHHRSAVYTMQRGFNDSENYLTVTKKETGETKTIDNSLIGTCEEGKQILAMAKGAELGTGCSTAYEKNGDIYVLFLYVTDGFLGSPCHYYILKYNFENHCMEYYTSVFFDDYPSILDLYIPQP